MKPSIWLQRAAVSSLARWAALKKGCELDALVIDDTTLFDPNERSLEERLERWLYVGDDRHIVERYVAGKVAPEPTN